MCLFAKWAAVVCCVWLHATIVCAENPRDEKRYTADEWKAAAETLKEAKTEPKVVVTEHTALIGGQKIAYTATAAKLVMKSDAGDPKANVFFVAYTKNDDTQDQSDRPVTFCFNGGPGSSSVWLHLGMLGPTRVKFDDNAEPLPPPHQLVANPYSLLDVTDLVFIDPVSTGFSRPVKGENKKQFHGYDEDLKSVAQFIHDYATRYGRWGSPKYLLGESYGGLRAAGLSGHLQQRYHMYLNGVVLISAVVDFQTLRPGRGNDIAYALFLPSYAATAWYHKALPESMLNQPVEQVVELAREFAMGEYMQALLVGDPLPDQQRKKVVARMSELTGLSADYLEKADLRVGMGRFGKQLLRDRERVVGRFDSRYIGMDRDDVGETTGHDPSAAVLFGPFSSAMNEYLSETLQVKEEQVYEILASNVHPWDYSEFTNRFVSASETLRKTMSENPHLKVFAACGYYDLATPVFAMEFTRDHLGLAKKQRKRFTTRYYEAGHMMYVHEPSLIQLRADLLEFYGAGTKEGAVAQPDHGEDKPLE